MSAARPSAATSLALAAVSGASALSLGRVFDGARFVLPVFVVALLPHAAGLACRARHVPVLTTIALTLVATGLVASWVVEGTTTAYGVPAPATLTALGRDLDAGVEALRRAVVPAPVTDGALLLAMVAVIAVALTADLLAFSTSAVSLGALAPSLALVVWTASLGTADLRTRAVLGYGAACVAFLAVEHQAGLALSRARFTGGDLRSGSLAVRVSAGAGAGALLLGALVGPSLPGANGDALINVRALGDGGDTGGGSYNAAPPLARIGAGFAEPREVEVFTVGAPAPEYWRTVALDRYTSEGGGQWTLAAEGPGEVDARLDRVTPDDALVQDFEITGLADRFLPAAYEATDIDGTDALVVRDSTSLVSTRTGIRGLRYTVTSAVPPDPRSSDDATGRAPPPDLQAFTELPDDFPDDVRALARDIVASSTSPAEAALALEAFFLDPAQGFVYDLGVELGAGAQSEGAIRRFVLGERRGFCVQFAGSYAAMARAVGLPARVAVGYTPGTFDPDSDRYRVTTWDAHAWPEVWLSGIGWVRLEPTPRSGLPGGSDLPSATDATPEVDSAPPPTAATAPPASSSAPSSPAEGDPGSPARISIDAPASETPDRTVGVRPSLAVLAVVAAGVLFAVPAAGAVVVVVVKARRRAQRRARSDPGAAVTGAWEDTVDRVREARIDSDRASTPRELAVRVEAAHPDSAVGDPMRSLAVRYSEARYGAVTPTEATARTAWTEAEAVRAALDAGCGRLTRWRRRADPRPLAPRGAEPATTVTTE